MNKNMAGILSAAAVLTMLAGCTAYDRTKDQFVQPVVKDVKKAWAGRRLHKLRVNLRLKWAWSMLVVLARPTSSGQRDGKAETYFVALDDTGHVINSGYQTCAEYDTDPQAAK